MTATTANDDAWNIGNVLLRRGALTTRQVEMVAEKQAEARGQQREVLFGDMCIELGYCTKPEIDAALQDQERALAPASNEEEAQQALADLDRTLCRAKDTSTRLQAVAYDLAASRSR